MKTLPTDTKNVLILSYGPVPTPEFQKIEGGGMRCWGLAIGLRDNGHNVTVSVFQEFRQQLKEYQGIGLHNWSLDNDFKVYMNSFDTVIVSYSMGDLSVFVADHLSHHVTLVLDCYVPIFIEISARDSDDKISELSNYLYETKRFNHVLRRGDFFLCANEPQKHMYAGILGSLGVINPYSYRQHRLLLVPFGVEANSTGSGKTAINPYKNSSKQGFVLLWFGGLYPWFNFKPIIKAIEELSKNPHFKFYLVGGKNPYNNHPDFVKQYDYVINEFKKLRLLDKSVSIVDWVDFDDRIRWYKNANLVISINSLGEENAYAWRTRVMDYLWGELPMLSNGGDPLSDELIASKAAVKIGLSSKEIAATVSQIMEDPKALVLMREKLLEIKGKYLWQKVTQVLSDQLNSENSLPYVDSLSFMEEHKINSDQVSVSEKQKVIRIVRKAKSYAVRAKQKGVKRSARFVADTIISQAKASIIRGRNNSKPKAFFLSHPIDHTGAPLVLLEIVNDFGKVLAGKDIHLVAPAIQRDLLNSLLKEDYKIHKMAYGIGGRLIQAGLQIAPNDFVLMNSMAMYQNYKTYIYWMLDTGKLKHAYWFIHEDNPSTRFGNKREVSRIRKLISDKKLSILAPSVQTAKDYNDFFETTLVKTITLRVQIPVKYQKLRNTNDFNTIKFFISGIPLDGRKGQLLFLSALQIFEAKYKTQNPNLYRPYSLDLVAIGNDYISQQIVSIGGAILGKNLNIHPVVERDIALEIAYSCNVTVCSSLNETFALYVAEGMLMGHPIIRNKSSGWQEQIKDGENGFIFDTLSVEDLAECIAKILNKTLSNNELLNMGKYSQKIADAFSEANYYSQIIIENSNHIY